MGRMGYETGTGRVYRTSLELVGLQGIWHIIRRRGSELDNTSQNKTKRAEVRFGLITRWNNSPANLSRPWNQAPKKNVSNFSGYPSSTIYGKRPKKTQFTVTYDSICTHTNMTLSTNNNLYVPDTHTHLSLISRQLTKLNLDTKR